MNNIHPKKLLHSKFTAATPVHKEKHFIVTAVEFDEDQTVTDCTIEAVISKRAFEIDWRDLRDDKKWLLGWR